jgi:hypothetical protein
MMRTKTRGITVLIGLLFVLASSLIPHRIEAGDVFISASMVRSLFEDAYSWFLDGTVKEQLFF